jgi:hypothetical protein
MFGTNTFLNGYARKAHPYDFNTVRLLIAGAEKLQDRHASTPTPASSASASSKATAPPNAAPWSASIPCSNPASVPSGASCPASSGNSNPWTACGGRPPPRARPQRHAGLPQPGGQRQIPGPGGWYDTGDIVKVDADGYAFILGRLKRFAKISGEMVSLTAVEDALAGAFPQFGLRCQSPSWPSRRRQGREASSPCPTRPGCGSRTCAPSSRPGASATSASPANSASWPPSPSSAPARSTTASWKISSPRDAPPDPRIP